MLIPWGKLFKSGKLWEKNEKKNIDTGQLY